MALLSVAQTRDGVWSVNERGPSRVAVAYFPSKFGAMKHALRVAGSTFTARRMIQQYATDYYAPAMGGEERPDDAPTA